MNANITEYEQGIVGAVIAYASKDDYANAIDEVIHKLPHQKYFQSAQLQLVWKAILTLHTNNQLIDLVTIAEQLDKANNLNKVGGRVYLVELALHCTPSAMSAHYSKAILSAYELRGLQTIGKAIQHQSKKIDAVPASIVADLEQQLTNLTTNSDDEQPIQTGDIATTLIHKVINRVEPNHDNYIKTRLTGVNDLTLGLRRKEVTIIGGDPSQGKTALTIDIVSYNAHRGRGCLFFTLDETERAVTQKIITQRTGISTKVLRRLEPIENQDIATLQAAEKDIKTTPIWIQEAAGRTILEMYSTARRYKRIHNISIIVIDFIQQLPRHDKFGTDDLFLQDCINIIKKMAMELNTQIIVLSQLSKNTAHIHKIPLHRGSKRLNFGALPIPTPERLRGSGSIHQGANVILFPWRPHAYVTNQLSGWDQSSGTDLGDLQQQCMADPTDNRNEKASVYVAKNKHGEIGNVDVYWDRKRARFADALSYEQAEPGEDLPF